MITHVIVSDLHLGAPNCILTAVSSTPHADTEGGSTSPPGEDVRVELSPAGECFAEMLHRLLRAHPDATLTLNGDILELGRGQPESSFICFEMFSQKVKQGASGGTGPAAAPKSLDPSSWLYIPGNHDHVLWQAAKLDLHRSRFVAELGEVAKRKASSDFQKVVFFHASPMLPQGRYEHLCGGSDLLGAFASPQLANSTERPSLPLRYPAFANCCEEGRRAVVIHHGHFAEPAYSFMSVAVARAVGHLPARPATLWDYESQNGAWLDFVWSGLGTAGQTGRNADLLFEVASGPEGALILGRVAERVAGWLASRTPIPRPISAKAGEWLCRQIQRHPPLERANQDVELTQAAMSQLREFLSGAVLRQFRTEYPKSNRFDHPEQLSMVFGHTHKPFAQEERVLGYSEPVALYNTGGWTVDRADHEPLKGADLVMVDDDLHVASLRLYRQGPEPVKALVTTFGPPESAARTGLMSFVQENQDFMAAFPGVVEEEVEKRRQAIRDRLKATADLLAGRRGW